MPAATKPRANDPATLLLRRYNKLREASLAMVALLRVMDNDQALRLPFPRYRDTFDALRKELE